MTNGPLPDLATASRLRPLRTRSISPENFDGAPGGGGRATEGTGAAAARDLGPGLEDLAERRTCPPGETFDAGRRSRGRARSRTSGSRRTPTTGARSCCAPTGTAADEPAIEVPYGDFFCNGWGEFAQVNSQAVAANPHGGFNSYWPMPFREGARLTVENTSDRRRPRLLPGHLRDRRRLPDERLPARAVAPRRTRWPSWSRTRIVEGVQGQRPVRRDVPRVGRQLQRLVGRGRDQVLPGRATPTTPPSAAPAPRTTSAVPGTSTSRARATREFSTPYLGMPQVIRPGRAVRQPAAVRDVPLAPAGPDPLRNRAARSTIQALGWRSGWRYLPLRDDIASTAFFYLDRPVTTRPPAPTADAMEVHLGTAPVPDVGATPPRPPQE